MKYCFFVWMFLSEWAFAAVSVDTLEIITARGTISGSLLIPDTCDKVPLVIMVPGSGQVDRDGNIPNLAGQNNAFKMLAESLEKEGVASLRYDKRGTAASRSAMIPEPEMRFDMLVDDLRRWISRLKLHEGISKIILLGHSQGSLVSILAAQKNPDVAGVISVGGAGSPIGLILSEQLKLLPAGLKEQADSILLKLDSGEKVEQVPFVLNQLFRKSVQPFLISWMAYDPCHEISQLQIPVLLVQGDTDLQVKVSEVYKLQKATQNSQLLVIEGMNHIMKPAGTDRIKNLATYQNPTLALHPELVPGLLSFINQVNLTNNR
ncbi:MAG: alpha/beta hydrolase [Candidatus Cyclobacteriaceae bacterium M3_2C_046]